jgi:hypothetical protein
VFKKSIGKKTILFGKVIYHQNHGKLHKKKGEGKPLPKKIKK